MYKGVIFDLDGTTLYTLEDINESFNLTLKEFGLPERDVDTIRMGVGRGFRILVDNVVPPETDKELKDKIALRYKEIYSHNYNNKTHPYEGMVEVMKELSELGVKLAVNSNKSDIFTKDLIATNFPDTKFTEVMGTIEGVALKPDPQAVEIILKEMNLNKDEVLYIGDSDIDMQTAKNAGMKSVGCLWGYRDLETLQNNGADYIAEKPEDIIRIVKEESEI